MVMKRGKHLNKGLFCPLLVDLAALLITLFTKLKNTSTWTQTQRRDKVTHNTHIWLQFQYGLRVQTHKGKAILLWKESQRWLKKKHTNKSSCQKKCDWTKKSNINHISGILYARRTIQQHFFGWNYLKIFYNRYWKNLLNLTLSFWKMGPADV